tara:strand:- start:109 stop:363 length:255 start_codon:yes stop_codon:yes gene_type:complete
MITRIRYNVIRRSISTKAPKIKVPKKFSEIPYHEQYESRDSSVIVNNIPDNITIKKIISSEVSAIINSKYSKKTLKEEFNKPGN